MNAPGHVICGSIISLIFIYFTHSWFGWFPINTILIAQAIIIIYIGTLLCDIDHEVSRITQMFTGIGLTIAVIGVIMYFLKSSGHMKMIIAGVGLAGLTYYTSQKAHHRGKIHSVPFTLGYAMVIFILTGFNWSLAALGFVSSWSHLLCDRSPLKLK